MKLPSFEAIPLNKFNVSGKLVISIKFMNTPEYYDFEYMIILDCTTGFTQLSCGDVIEMDDNVYDKPDVVKMKFRRPVGMFCVYF